jgi:hypothetical protein
MEKSSVTTIDKKKRKEKKKDESIDDLPNVKRKP